ncbi:protein mono-ADP-ribosyltransferase PARP14-like [Mugil cephalus]|uniref:protein mono-ADP-ribosyltransferase PARP14-like n=1 Tax=Mugil cephalus TaxID=48193 RepID=UPI001FB5B510|nr:protein mono-ADP-ribosyltransferase PARP14-like [Mugil cephalus]
MDEYPHPLFFEARDLTDREREKLRRYFNKKRDSGGGDCGTIQRTEDNIYKVCFKEREDQERVLQRKFHTVSLPGGELRLTVSRASTPQNSDQPSTSQAQVFTKANTKTLEKRQRLDVFLIYYLRDNPKASKLLGKQLSAVGCTFELDFDEEEVVIRGDIEKGPGGAFGGTAEKWEQQVDLVFVEFTERFSCHHVFEPKQVKMLLQDHSLAADDVKVYPESGYAVVVGDVQVVNARIETLTRSVSTSREVPVVQKQFNLVEEEFSREMRANYPEVKITRGSAMIILEGPDKEVQLGETKLNELIKRIKEKRLQLPTDLITFIRLSSAISKYQARFKQSLRHPVSLQVGSDLLLSSLSSDALDEAEAAVMRDLNVESVNLQGAAAVPPDLDRVKEILNKAKDKENSGELRVDVKFIPGSSGTAVTKVQLVGYSVNVKKLKDVLHDYMINQVETQEFLNLPQPELVDCFDRILQLIPMKQTKAMLKASQFPSPCVIVSGPRCHVQEAKQALTSALGSLITDTLVLDGPGAQRFFQTDGKESKELVESSFQVLIREKKDVHSPRVNVMPQLQSLPCRIKPRGHSLRFGSIAVNKMNLNIKIGSLEHEQGNVLVVPMLNKQLTSTNVGTCLLNKAGNAVKSRFDSVVANHTLAPGDVMQVDAPPSLGCTKIFFIECLPWDGLRGNSAQALGNGLRKCLDLCAHQGLKSVAFPIIGPGIVLKFPLRGAIEVLTESIRQFGLSTSTGSLSAIHIVIKPGYPDSEECYHDVYKYLSLNMNQGDQVIFGSLTSDLDNVTMAVGGGVDLHVVFGDITNETTDVVVNTTDFKNFNYDGVCKDILTVAGPQMENELRAANVNRGDIIVSKPGNFPCKSIFHVCGEKDAGLIEELVCKIIDYCEKRHFQSVAIPAICAGVGGLDPGVVAGAILRGIKTATSSTSPHLRNIRLVLIKINVFLAFKEEAMQAFATAAVKTVPQFSHHQQQQQQQQSPQSLITDLSFLQTSSTSQKSVFMFLGFLRKDIDDAMAKLKSLYQTQYSSKTFRKEELEGLTQDDMEDLKQLVENEGLYMKTDQSGSLTVSGLKDGVTNVLQKFSVFQQDILRRAVISKEEEELYNRVVWCLLGYTGNWERLPKTANHKLENKDIAEGIFDALGTLLTVDLQKMEATRNPGGQIVMLKRLENLPDFTFPLYWDDMAPGEVMKKVPLVQSSAEFKTVKEAFKRTVTKTVVKIERLQNIHLRRAYEAQKNHISHKNATEGGAHEKMLYHGTTEDNCNSIMKTGFNRNFAGQNATVYGCGTYFAVNANYSAQPTYSRPAADGSQLMFVARVLTGIHTQGQSNMRMPPPRDSQQPHDRYDSVVDRMDNPSMYVVFHDSQAYPDYLITFK